MALLNLLAAAFFAVYGLFDTGGSGSGGDAAGSGGDSDLGDTSGTNDAGADGAEGGGDGEPDLKSEVAKWKSLSRKHEAEAKKNADAARRLREAEDADKSEIQKATERATTAEKDRDEARGQLLRLEIATEKGLTPAQAKRLVGATREELVADADELLEAFGGKPGTNGEGDKREPLRRPTSKPRSGAVPDAEPEDNDPVKLAAMVPRN